MAEKPEDLNLPNTVIAKIIREALPENVSISKDARIAISKAASVFVLYSTSCANNFAMQQKRKTISAQDVYEAMTDMEFERYVEPLKKSLEMYRTGQKEKKDTSDKRKKDKDTSTSSKTPDDSVANDDDEDGNTMDTMDDVEEISSSSST